ncbi:P-loop containing nucleoside triphosphate hydrolase protein [Aspergillus cavernicola]|uniref:RNA helicase n=1 Tax=Aspergillus cavernicola TaxID=176166 RepID=A0ABR4HYM6_9EURO
MQPWTGKGSRRLLRAFQASLRPLVRTFTITPAFQATKRMKKPAPKPPNTNNYERSAEFDLKSAPKVLRKSIVAQDFPKIVANMLKEVRHDRLPNPASEEQTAAWIKLERYIMNSCYVEDSISYRHTPGTIAVSGYLRQIKQSLQNGYLKSGLWGLRNELEYIMYSYDISANYSAPNLGRQRKIADLRYPAQWYPQARATQRTIHLHVGPTNSGKTYHALQRLREAKSGFYAGPLRLLAQEVYHRFQSSGIPCSLVTGDDVKTPEGQKPVIVSNTVEMVNLGQPYEVGVIDEIQMIGDSRRGWAWTRAVLGSRATELHLCGENRAVPLIRELAALTGDKLEIHRYERLNPLRVMDKSLQGDLKHLQKGDCVVVFSRVGIHALKADIEKVTGRRAAIVYGGLPAEIRTQQASLFNDPDNDYDFLVASDAIGMGLNLSCRRIIFETLVKRTPEGLVRLTTPEIKQIAGRAGRYRTAAAQKSDGKSPRDDGSNIGYVTSLEDVDLPFIRQAMTLEPPPLSTAGIAPPDSVFEKFAAYFPQNVPLEYMIKRLTEISQVHPLFSMCDPGSALENAEVIDSVAGLQLADQLTFMAAPIQARETATRDVAIAFAHCISESTDGRLLDIPDLNLEVLEEPVSGNKGYMAELESLHKSVILYNWLSYRFGGIFTDRTLAVHVKELVEERMVRALTEFSANKKLRKDASLHRQIALQKQILERKQFMNEAEEPDTPVELHTSDELDTPDSEDSSAIDVATDEGYEEQPAHRAYSH